MTTSNTAPTKEPDYCYPFKFFMPVPSDAMISIYMDIFETTPPPQTKPDRIVKASELDSLPELKGSDVWEAYTESGEWVGTSEL